MPSIKANTVPITVKKPFTPHAQEPKADDRCIARRRPKGKGMPSTNPSGAINNNAIVIRPKMPNPKKARNAMGVIKAVMGTSATMQSRTRFRDAGPNFPAA